MYGALHIMQELCSKISVDVQVAAVNSVFNERYMQLDICNSYNMRSSLPR